MATSLWRRISFVSLACVVIPLAAMPAYADEIWVAPTSQADIGGLGVASNVFWPVTPVGVVRLAWSIPNDLQTFQGAKVAIIPGAPAGGPPALHFYVCAAQNGTIVSSDCTGPFVQTFTSVANQLTEVEIGGVLSQHLGTPGSNYLAILAYTTPATTTDHVVGLRFSYAPAAPTGVATLAANTYTGTQTAPLFSGSFNGDGTSVTNVNAALLNGVAATALAPSGGSPNYIQNGSTAQAASFNVSGNGAIGGTLALGGDVTKNGSPLLHSGSGNIFLGPGAGTLTVTGGANVAFGPLALGAVSFGAANTAVGAGALNKNTGGSDNVAVGDSALSNDTLGGANIAIGSEALQTNQTSCCNVAIGIFALKSTTGQNNIAIGSSAGMSATFGSNNIYLGANINGVAGESNTMYLGLQGTQTKTFVAGIRGSTTVNNDAIPVMIDSAGQLGTISSSIRFKEDIRDMTDVSQRLFNLRPVTFRYTKPYANGSKPIQFGLVAEEVAEAFPELAVRDGNGNVETVHYETLNVLLLNEVQRQQRELALEQNLREDQQKRIDILEQRLNELMIQRTTTQP